MTQTLSPSRCAERIETMLENSEYDLATAPEVAIELLTDIAHWCDARDIDFEVYCEDARKNAMKEAGNFTRKETETP